jgi:hypothetical protein
VLKNSLMPRTHFSPIGVARTSDAHRNPPH